MEKWGKKLKKKKNIGKELSCLQLPDLHCLGLAHTAILRTLAEHKEHLKLKGIQVSKTQLVWKLSPLILCQSGSHRAYLAQVSHSLPFTLCYLFNRSPCLPRKSG